MTKKHENRQLQKLSRLQTQKQNLKQSILDNDKNRIVKYAKQLMLLEEQRDEDELMYHFKG